MSDAPDPPVPPPAADRKPIATQASLARLIAAQARTKAAQDKYQALHRLLPGIVAELVRLGQNERRAAEAGRDGRAAAAELIGQMTQAMRQMTESINGEHASLLSLLDDGGLQPAPAAASAGAPITPNEPLAAAGVPAAAPPLPLPAPFTTGRGALPGKRQ